MIFVFVLLLLAFAPVSAQMDIPTPEPTKEIHEFGFWEYITNFTGLTITAYHGTEKIIEIPEEIYGIRVTALADNLFKSNTTVQSVNIPDSVTTIGTYAFHGCTSLKDVHLPAGLMRIESYTFRYCASLEKIDFPSTLSIISSYSFSGCIGLTSLIIPDSVTEIHESGFDECTSLEKVIISKNLNYMGTNAFRNTPWLDAQTDEFVIVGNNLLIKWNGNDSRVDIPYGITFTVDAFKDNPYVETITIPSSVHRIGPASFRGAVNLRTIEIPDSVTRIDSHAFRECRSLREINLPETVTYLGSQVFRGCEKLKTLTIPSKVSLLNSYLLADCSVLTDVVIPANVTLIEDYAFNNSPFIRLLVTYDSEGERYALSHNIPYTYYLQQTKDFIYSKNDEGIQILKYIGNLYEVDIPAEIDGYSVNRINTAAFQDNSIAKRITIPSSVTTIGDWAFSYMDSLESVTLSSKLKSLGADAFTGSNGLKSITLPKSLEEIGVEPFAGLDDLEIIVDGKSKAAELLSGMGYDLGLDLEKKDSSSEKTDMTDAVENGPEDDFTESTAEISISEPISDETEDVSSVVITETVNATESTEENPAEIASENATSTSVPTAVPAADTPEPTATSVPVVNTPEPIAASVPAETDVPAIAEINDIEPTDSNPAELKTTVKVPDGATEVTVEMLKNTADVLTLIIPDSVTFIDDAIVSGHELTIVSSPSTEAERFARKWDLKFLIDLWYEEE